MGVTALLLDTHVLLWALVEPGRIPEPTRAAQAMTESLPLVTMDAALPALPGLRIVW